MKFNSTSSCEYFVAWKSCEPRLETHHHCVSNTSDGEDDAGQDGSNHFVRYSVILWTTRLGVPESVVVDVAGCIHCFAEDFEINCCFSGNNLQFFGFFFRFLKT